MNNILLIEDDPAIRLGLKEFLKSESYNVYETPDGKEGLDMALETKPDLILLDINLPSLNGFDVCRKLRENKFDNPVIMLTSHSDNIDKVVGLEIGADDYITKPFDNREVLARIRAQLRKHQRFVKLDENLIPLNKYQRKLLAVMFTDIQDYSKVMNKDEQLALGLLEDHNGIIKDCIKVSRGKIIEITGDAFLVIFDSAVDAVYCGVDIQKEFKNYNKTRKTIEQIKVRIGIHLGDVVAFDGKIKGDIVNIAARIQQNSKAGSVYFSQAVNEAIKNKTGLKIKYLGKYSVKNIQEDLDLYKIIT